jgi:hypothetical protein
VEVAVCRHATAQPGSRQCSVEHIRSRHKQHTHSNPPPCPATPTHPPAHNTHSPPTCPTSGPHSPAAFTASWLRSTAAGSCVIGTHTSVVWPLLPGTIARLAQ